MSLIKEAHRRLKYTGGNSKAMITMEYKCVGEEVSVAWVVNRLQSGLSSSSQLQLPSGFEPLIRERFTSALEAYSGFCTVH